MDEHNRGWQNSAQRYKGTTKCDVYEKVMPVLASKINVNCTRAAWRDYALISRVGQGRTKTYRL